jgi:hypothetical protein
MWQALKNVIHVAVEQEKLFIATYSDQGRASGSTIGFLLG